jgi:hypothetical protein
MVQKTFNNLKQNGSKEDKVAVASGVAVSVVVVLLLLWAIFFFRNIRNGSQQLQLSGGAQDQFNFSGVKEAQQQLEAQFGSQTQSYQDIQAQSAQGQSGAMQTQPMEVQGTTGDQFNAPAPATPSPSGY